MPVRATAPALREAVSSMATTGATLSIVLQRRRSASSRLSVFAPGSSTFAPPQPTSTKTATASATANIACFVLLFIFFLPSNRPNALSSLWGHEVQCAPCFATEPIECAGPPRTGRVASLFGVARQDLGAWSLKALIAKLKASRAAFGARNRTPRRVTERQACPSARGGIERRLQARTQCRSDAAPPSSRGAL
jgi:hypothetical protein